MHMRCTLSAFLVCLIAPLAWGQAAVRPMKLVPAVPAVPVEGQEDTESVSISPAESARLKAIYEALPPDEQAEMREHYDALGIDLNELFTEKEPEKPGVAEAPRKKPILSMVQRKKFARTPQTVLAARTKMGLEVTERPAEDAEPKDVVEWLHLQVMAGEWEELEWFLAERAGDEAEGIYSHILQSTNQGDPMLLPEEVLDLANAAAGEPTNWQINVLAKLLKQSSSRTSTRPMLAELDAGTRLYGGENVENHPRTAALLTRSGMSDEAYRYLPSLKKARAIADEQAILIHGIYHLDRAEEGGGAAAAANRLEAWHLFGEVTLMFDADMEIRQEALRKAMTLLPEVPEDQAMKWLDEVIAQDRIAPAALEIIALDAMNLRGRKLNEAQKARAIVVMQTAVDRLLDSERVDTRTLRVPLRMLTTGLVAEAEASLAEKPNRQGVNAGAATLLRAVPDEQWLETIEPSLAVRAYRAFIGVATNADETDRALEILEQAVKRHPDAASDLAADFLGLWVKRLRPDSNSSQTAAMRTVFFAFGGRSTVPAAPLTRGRQSRNLDRLQKVLDLVNEIGVDPRSLSNLVQAFRACHSRAETYNEEDIVAVLGPIEEMPASTAAMLSGSMRSGLGGDWRSREVQQQFGMRRNASEIAQVVENGYALAIQLADQAIEKEPDSWEHAVNKAALAYDRLEHRKAMNEGEVEGYNEIRRQAFDAFADAAATYARAVGDGRLKASPNVYLAWFNAAVGATDLGQLTRDNILYEGSERDTQIDRIREAIEAMPPAMADEHLGMVAQSLSNAVKTLNPEVKPRVVRHALRIVGDHPLASPLRRINTLYKDLIEDEIHLRLTLDGSDQVGTEDLFGAVLSLRYTNAVDRETDGFSKYLQNEVWVRIGNNSRYVNYRDRLQRSIENALGEQFDIEAISYFDSMHPSDEVREGGESGWQEKPLAYLVLKARDSSLDRLPSIQMDLDFVDTTGPVILAIESNAPSIDAASESVERPLSDLAVSQVVDTRSAEDGEVLLEIQARGRGVLPEVDRILSGLETPLEGFAIVEEGIKAHPVGVAAENQDDLEGMFFRRRGGDEEEKTYVGRDEDGVYRPFTERSWTVRYVPTAAATGNSFVLPVLAGNSDGMIQSRYFNDLDLVVAETESVPVKGGMPWWYYLLGLLAIGVAILALAALLTRRSDSEAGGDGIDQLLPARDTPLGAIAALRRIDEVHGGGLGNQREGLLADIRGLEEDYFSPSANGGANGKPRDIVDRWISEVRGRR